MRHLSRTDMEQDLGFYNAESCSPAQIISFCLLALISNRQLHKQLTGVCSPVLRNILSVSAPVLAAVSFMDICFAFGSLFPGGNHFPTSQSSLSANWGCVFISVKHLEIHQCKISGESCALLAPIFALPTCSIYLGSAPSHFL